MLDAEAWAGDRISFGSLDTIDIPAQKHRRLLPGAFGSDDQLGKHAGQATAIEFTSASFSWSAQPAVLGSHSASPHSAQALSEARRSSLVLRDINISIPEGKLTVVYGEVGSGKLSHFKTPQRQTHDKQEGQEAA